MIEAMTNNGKITTMPFFEFKEKVKTAGSITRNRFLKKEN